MVDPSAVSARSRMAEKIEPFSWRWGLDRGLPVHRYYLERFLAEHSADIRGAVLEFQDPQYSPRFAGGPIDQLDILHIDASNPLATLVGDLTQTNDLPSDRFDCIVCTHVLHVIPEAGRAVGELERMLRPGGVLLVVVPAVSMVGEAEFWRYTQEGLAYLLTRSFSDAHVQVRGYGNSLTAAAEIRGLVASEFEPWELDQHDPRFPVQVCGRAMKA